MELHAETPAFVLGRWRAPAYARGRCAWKGSFRRQVSGLSEPKRAPQVLRAVRRLRFAVQRRAVGACRQRGDGDGKTGGFERPGWVCLRSCPERRERIRLSNG